MIPKVVMLLLVAAAAVSAHIIPIQRSHPHKMVLLPTASSGCPSALEPAPLICKFMQPDMEYHYKPPLIATSTYIPPLVVEKCDNPQLEIELPAPVVEKKPIVIPEAPVLPPITIPKFPVPVIVEKPIRPPVAIPEPCEPTFIPDIPVMKVPFVPALPPIPATPEIIVQPEPCVDDVVFPETSHKPMVVPQPPELPAFLMPELPVRVEVPKVEPCLEDQPIPVAPIPEYIPPAPMPLPTIEPAFIPEMPVLNIPEAPELPALEMPALLEIVAQPEPCFDEVRVVVPEAPFQPMVVPQPPELPAFVMPNLPVKVEVPLAEPCLEDQPVPVPMPEYIPLPAPKPLPLAEPCEPAFVPELPSVKIPSAPELPPLEMPVLPEIIAQPEPYLTEIVAPEVTYQPTIVPQAPELPAFVMPELPMRVEPPKIFPCPEDHLPIVTIPDYINQLAPMPAGPELPIPLSKIPVRIEVPSQPILTPMQPDPCFTGEIALVVPQLPNLPEPVAKPIIPAYPEQPKPDPCEPSSKPENMAEIPRYFVTHPSQIRTMPMGFSFYPGVKFH